MLAITTPFHSSHRLDLKHISQRKTKSNAVDTLAHSLDVLDFAYDHELHHCGYRQMQDKATEQARNSINSQYIILDEQQGQQNVLWVRTNQV